MSSTHWSVFSEGQTTGDAIFLYPWIIAIGVVYFLLASVQLILEYVQWPVLVDNSNFDFDGFRWSRSIKLLNNISTSIERFFRFEVVASQAFPVVLHEKIFLLDRLSHHLVALLVKVVRWGLPSVQDDFFRRKPDEVIGEHCHIGLERPNLNWSSNDPSRGSTTRMKIIIVALVAARLMHQSPVCFLKL